MEEEKKRQQEDEEDSSNNLTVTSSSNNDSMGSSGVLEHALLQPIPVSMEVNDALDVSVKSSSVWRSDDTVDV